MEGYVMVHTSQNPEWQSISTLDTKLALVLARSVEVFANDVDGWWQADLNTLELEDNVWQRVDVAAVRVDLTNSSSQVVDAVSRANDEGSSSIEDAAAASEETIAVALILAVNQDTIQTRLPVVLGRDWDVLEVASELGVIDATKENARVAVTRGGIKIDGEKWLVNQLLSNHVIENWGNIIGSNAWISKTENTVHWLVIEEVSERGSLTEDLVLDVDGNDSGNILIQNTAHGASTILNL